ncbi:MAG: hypothetical protein ABL985_04590 [Casimicrobium sp.]
MNTANTSKVETIGAAPVVTIAAAGVNAGSPPSPSNRPLVCSGLTARGAGRGGLGGLGYWGAAHRPS